MKKNNSHKSGNLAVIFEKTYQQSNKPYKKKLSCISFIRSKVSAARYGGLQRKLEAKPKHSRPRSVRSKHQ